MHRKQLIPVWLLVMSSFAVAQTLSPDIQSLDELSSARALVAASEDELGRHDMGMIEPLEQLASELMALNQFDQADAVLDRALQLTRLQNGLHTPAQLGLIRTRIENFSNQQDWASAREQMDYLFAYYLRVPVKLEESLIDDFLALAEQHLRGAKEDSQIEQGRHLSRIYQINQAIIYTASQLYGQRSPEVAPYIYRQVRHTYLFQKGNDAGGRTRTNANFHHQLRGQTISWRRNSFKQKSYSDGLWLLSQIRQLHAGPESADPEGEAMAELYIADWHLLFDFANKAKDQYARAYKALQAAGVSDEELKEFFSKPQVLPVRRFHPILELAAGDSDDVEAVTSQNTEGTLMHRLSFIEWSTDYPTTRNPLLLDYESTNDPDYALFEFTLPATNESTFFYKHRYEQTIGRPVDVELLHGFTRLPNGNELAQERLDQLRFRPQLQSGVPIESRIQFQYGIAATLTD